MNAPVKTEETCQVKAFFDNWGLDGSMDCVNMISMAIIESPAADDTDDRTMMMQWMRDLTHLLHAVHHSSGHKLR